MDADEAFRELVRDGGNAFAVGRLGTSVCILNPPRGPISKSAAANLAAYLIMLAELTPADLEAVMGPQGCTFPDP
jgi:hypothetical protein